MNTPLEDQVHASLQQLLRNLQHIEEEYDITYIDTLLLHSPYPDFADTMRAWCMFESYVPNRIRALGVSNITFPALKQLFDAAKIKPTVVQVRFHPESDFEVLMRKFCSQRGIVFQAHKVLKGN
jgi:diketogulonate reductase-like aldo/keto reductase